MITTVILINCLISLVCFYTAWKLWQIRQVLSLTTKVVTAWERNTHNTLALSPDAILNGKLCIQQLRENYQHLEPQLQQLQRMLALVSLLQLVWRSARNPMRSPNKHRRP